EMLRRPGFAPYSDDCLLRAVPFMLCPCRGGRLLVTLDPILKIVRIEPIWLACGPVLEAAIVGGEHDVRRPVLYAHFARCFSFAGNGLGSPNAPIETR